MHQIIIINKKLIAEVIKDTICLLWNELLIRKYALSSMYVLIIFSPEYRNSG